MLHVTGLSVAAIIAGCQPHAVQASNHLLLPNLFIESPNIRVFVVQNGSGPDGGSPDSTPDDISGAPEMDTLSTPVLAGPVRRSEL